MNTRRAKTVFLFPGQGAQTLGMADRLTDDPASAAIFRKASEILGYEVTDLCARGPEEKLNSTVYSQPAIFTVSAVLLDRLRRRRPDLMPDVTAGLSMGEYTALYAAGLIEFEDALRLVQKRGQAMQAAADKASGAMVSILGLDEDQVRRLCDQAAEGQILEPVNFNCPGQIVISGEVEACRRAAQLAESFGAIKAVPLAVAGAFHTSMMAPAADELEAALASTPIRDLGEVRVLANITADDYGSADEIRRGLIRQLVEPILWQKCMERLLAEGAEQFYEIGPGRVLSGLMKRIQRRAAIRSINSVESLEALS